MFAHKLAQGVSSLEKGLSEAAGSAGIRQTGSEALPGLAGTIIGSLLSLMAVLFFILTLYGGFIWMTARGNEERVNKGKQSIIAAVIGMIVVMGSYAITNFILGSTGPLTSQEEAQNCTALGPEWSCRNIDDCGSILLNPNVGSGSSVETKRAACSADAAMCRLNLCPGGNEIVCCQ